MRFKQYSFNSLKENSIRKDLEKVERRMKRKDAERLDLLLQRGFAKAVNGRTEFMIFKIELVGSKTDLLGFLCGRLRGVHLYELELFHPSLNSAMFEAQRKGLVQITGAGRYPTSQCLDFYH